MKGIIETHFSLGSFFSSQGFGTEPFSTLLEWKNLCDRLSRADDDAIVDVVLDGAREKGFEGTEWIELAVGLAKGSGMKEPVGDG